MTVWTLQFASLFVSFEPICLIIFYRAKPPMPQALFCRLLQQTDIKDRRQSLFLCGLKPL